ncbi:hypothetical protein GCM10011507_23720 [Edaphobacter acidisoli]|uniref:Uncharacterized protein n=1 Tax=Edaphobacter acidisoli TaxID=2040573 RepID=A0A916W673_9BACT|nr:hypothetical protein GCM10011507_23720 [Edaphobacter acidisoli]
MWATDTASGSFDFAQDDGGFGLVRVPPERLWLGSEQQIPPPSTSLEMKKAAGRSVALEDGFHFGGCGWGDH